MIGVFATPLHSLLKLRVIRLGIAAMDGANRGKLGIYVVGSTTTLVKVRYGELWDNIRVRRTGEWPGYLGVFKCIRIRKSDLINPKSDLNVSKISDIRINIKLHDKFLNILDIRFWYPNPYPKNRMSEFRISEISDRDSDTKIYYPIFRISEFSDIRHTFSYVALIACRSTRKIYFGHLDIVYGAVCLASDSDSDSDHGLGLSPTSPIKRLRPRTESDIRGNICRKSLRFFWADRVRGKRSDRVRGLTSHARYQTLGPRTESVIIFVEDVTDKRKIVGVKGARTVEEPGETGSFDGNGRLWTINLLKKTL
ncbi:hypothetical protein LXL04_025639 [Taraxacum kok-saghyz]